MKFPRSVLYALIFVAFVAALAGIIMLLTPKSSSTTSSTSQGFFSTLFPFGRTSVTQAPPARTEDTTQPGEAPVLRKVSEAAVAGATFAQGIGGLTYIRYTERDTGHIYETPVDQVTALRLIHSTVPAVHDSVWVNASTTIMRFLGTDSEIQNFVGTIASSTTDQELTGVFIKNYARIAVGPKSTVLGVLETATGSTLEKTDFVSKKTEVVFTSPLRSWIPLLTPRGTYVSSAPSGTALGTLYKVEGRQLTRVLDPRLGFQVLPQENGDVLAVSGGSLSATSLTVYNLKNGSAVNVPIGTLVDKCAWGGARATSTLVCAMPKSLPAALYPDDWLLGRVHTDDDLYAVNIDTGAVTRVFDLANSGSGPFDVSHATLSSDATHFLFINRNDQTLWSARLTQ